MSESERGGMTEAEVRERQRGVGKCYMAGFADGRGSKSQRPLDNGKGKEVGSPFDLPLPPEETQLGDTLIFSVTRPTVDF